MKINFITALDVIQKFFANFLANIRQECITYVLVILIIAIIIIIFRIMYSKHLKRGGYLKKPNVFVALIEWWVDKTDRFILDNANPKMLYLGPWYGFIVVGVFANFITGLFGIKTTMSLVSITLTFGLISFVVMQIHSVRGSGLWGWFKGKFLSPFFVFLPMNLLSFWAPVLSLSLRMFGNSLAGGVITSLLKDALLPFTVGGVNIAYAIVGPFVSLYFDIFSAFIQTMVFLMLSVLLTDLEWDDSTE